VVSVDQDDEVRLYLFGKPALDRLVAFEKRFSGGIRLFLLVLGPANGADVGRANTGDYPGHQVALER
jgi:hypothetical protein